MAHRQSTEAMNVDDEHASVMSSNVRAAVENGLPSELFKLKRWNGIAMWAYDVGCDTCAICRVELMDMCLRCQTDQKQDECVIVWGECNHCFHNCCMSQWTKQNNRCPLCQQDWVVMRIG